MALDKQIARLSFFQGVETKVDKYQIIQTKMDSAENVVMTKVGRFQKRQGYKALASTINNTPQQILNARHITTYQDQAFVTDATNAYSLSQVQQTLIPKGTCEAIGINIDPIVNDTFDHFNADLATHPLGLNVAAWEDSRGGVWYNVYDSTTQQVLQSAQISSTSIHPKCIELGNYIIILYAEPAINELRYVVIPIISPTVIPTPSVFANNLDAAAVYDATNIGGSVYVGYKSSLSPFISLKYITASLTVSSEVPISGNTGCAQVAIFGDVNKNVWLLWFDDVAGLLAATIWDYTLVNQLLALTTIVPISTNITHITGIISTQPGLVVAGGVASVAYEVSDTLSYNHYIYAGALLSDGTTASSGVFARSVGLAGKLFIANNQVHVPMAYESQFQPSYFLASANQKIVARWAPAVGGGLIDSGVPLPETNLEPSGAIRMAYLQSNQFSTSTATVLSQTGVQAITFDFSAQQQSLEFSSDLHITGGILWQYDGSQTYEHNFFLWPENVAAVLSNSGGSMGIPGGTAQYQYAVVWEYTDAGGLRHQSAVSIPAQSQVTTTTGNTTSSVQITIPCLRLTNKPLAIQATIYRTQANQNVFYRVTPILTPLYNSLTANTVVWVDTLSDAAIAGNNILYTTGGEVENICAPAPKILTSYQNRMILVPSEKPFTWWFSKDVIEGLPVEFNDGFQQSVSQLGGPITAVYQLDDKIIIFKNNYIFYTSGAGPTRSGVGGEYPPALFITADTGCIDPKSIVRIPDGLMFQSNKGIFLLDRGLGTSYIGSAVEDYNGLNISSAVIVPDTTQVRFNSFSGTTLVYDWFVKEWYTFTNIEAQDATIFQSLMTYIKPDGTIAQETPGEYADLGNYITQKATTAWLSFSQLQGYERVWKLIVLGEYRGPHQLRISIAYDFNPIPTQIVTVDAATLMHNEPYGTELYGVETPYGGEYPLYQFRVMLERQRCQSIQITLEDIGVDAPSEGASWSAIGFEYGTYRGVARKPAVRTFG